MTGEIMHHLAATGRMADVNRILQVEMIGDRLQIVGIMIHIMSVAGLSRATMSAPIGRNDAIAFAEEEKHIRVPIVRRQRPTMAEDNRLTAAPILVINVDVLSVFFSASDIWHSEFLSIQVARCDAAGPWHNQTQFMFLQSTASSCKFSANFTLLSATTRQCEGNWKCLIWQNANQLYCCSREVTKALTANFGEFTSSVSAMVAYPRLSSPRYVKP